MSVKSVSMKRIFVALVVCALLAVVALAAATAMPSQAFATKSEPYDYTIRVFGGNEGTYDGQAIYKTTVKAGEEFKLDSTLVAVSNDKYYAKGFREGGKDELAQEAFTVNKDMDFVVAYGVKGEMVSYTISFVEYGTGNALANDQGATSVTYHGKQGDKPVVAYEYVPGYRPRYLNVTGTLGPEGSNNWELEYIPLATTEVVETTTTTTATEGGAAAAGTEGGAATGGAAAAGTEGGAAAGGTEGGAATGGTEGGAATATPPETEQIIDVDNPLAGGTEDNDKQGSATISTASDEGGIPIVPIAIVIAVVVVVIAILAVVLDRKKR